MPRHPGRQGEPRLSPASAEAARTLRDLQAIGGRSRKAAYAKFTRIPLALWGTAWLVGYAGLDILPWVTAIPLGLALSALAVVGTALSHSDEVVNGWERRVQLSWLVLMASSPLLVAIITPAPAHTVLIFLGALWGIALLLFAVAAADFALAAVGAIILGTATAVHVLSPARDLLVFGVVAGGSMAALGLRRMRMPG